MFVVMLVTGLYMLLCLIYLRGTWPCLMCYISDVGWKEAIASDHVKLVIFTESEPPGCTEPAADNLLKADDNNNFASSEALESSASATVKAKFRPMPEKGTKLKYIPKKRINT